LKTVIPFTVEVEKMGPHRKTILAYANNLAVRAAYPALSEEPWPLLEFSPSASGTDDMQDTVLVVEDEADMVDLLRYILSKAGFGVLIAPDGITGLEIVPMLSSSIPCFRIWMDTPSVKR
jgi:hypothetical protein